jgi:hypothetical protein
VTHGEEVSVVEWVAAISMFWAIAALYLGGFQIRFEGADGPRQLVGLLICFALYMVVFGVLRMVLTGPMGGVVGVIVAVLISCALIPLLSRVAFRVVGVRIARAVAAHH